MRVDEITFKPKATAEQIARGEQWLVENRASFVGAASYLIIGEDTERAVFSGPCHGGIASSGNPDKRVLVATKNGAFQNFHVSGGLDTALYEPFLHWLLYDSYMGRFILNKENFEFCRDHGFIVSADVYAPLMQNILITTRHFTECGVRAFETFAKLVDKGIDPNIAYVVCFCSGWSGSGNAPINSVIVSYGNHRAHHLFNLSTLNNFLNGELGKSITNNPLSHYRNRLNYVGGAALFVTQSGSFNFAKDLIRIDEKFRKALSEYRGESTEIVYKAPNPFVLKPLGGARMPKAPDDFTYQEMFEMVLPYMMENKETWRS